MPVQEVFFSVDVDDMQRAITFYVDTLDATIEFASESWSSLEIAGVHLSLILREHAPARIGLHLIVGDVVLVCCKIVRAGGQLAPAVETANGIVFSEVTDTEGNTFMLRQRFPVRERAGYAGELQGL